jgi:tetraacyldisaccharide-1-P 4'-kinase
VREIIENAEGAGARLILTTQKDFVKVKDLWKRACNRDSIPCRLGILEISVEIEPAFWDIIKARI